MADMTKLFAGDPQSISAAAEVGLNVLKPVLHFQIVMLRMWADSIERLAGNYEKGADEFATAVKQRSNRDHAA